MWFEAAISQVGRLAQGLTDLATASLADDEAEWAADLKPFSIAAMMEDVAALWAIPARDKGLELTFVHCSHIAMSDGRMVMTILNNLVGNAIKHSDFGRVLVGCRPRGAGIRIDIIDSGPGIADHHQAAIFRAGERAASRKPGMGLGLTLVAELCARLAVDIELVSALGRGSRFSITLPRF